MNHLHDFILDVAGLFHSVHAGDKGGGADKNVADADLAAAVALTMIRGEPLHEHPRKIDLSVKEDVFLGNKDILEHGQDFLPAKDRIADIAFAPVPACGYPRPAVHKLNFTPGALVGTAQQTAQSSSPGSRDNGRHDDDLVGVEHAGLMQLAAADDNAVRLGVP